ncbi:MAG: hypothetical protein MK179_01185 [Pirellulaceae bacterium]|nr:hypothetical protein [Pirellulaceae bacterium]
MGGPIVRSGPSPEYSRNWDQIFGSEKDNNVNQESQQKQDDATEENLQEDNTDN